MFIENWLAAARLAEAFVCQFGWGKGTDGASGNLSMAASSERVSSRRQSLIGLDDAAARAAARILGRMRSGASEAVDELIAAATRRWECGCPQRFAEAITAPVKISPWDARLVAIIRDTIRCSNYGIQKACIQALRDIGTEEAIETIYDIDQYWHAAPRTRQIKKLIY